MPSSLKPSAMDRPQAIIIIGNIASGKTTLARLISAELPDYQYICLDDIRVNMMELAPDMNSIVRERISEDIVLKKINESRYIIYESTGASQFYNRAMLRIREKFEVFTVKLEANMDTCYGRFEDRKKNGQFQVPPGLGSRMDIKSQIHRLQGIIRDMPCDFFASSEYRSPLYILHNFLIKYSLKFQKSNHITHDNT
jgi:shikimate kinase